MRIFQTGLLLSTAIIGLSISAVNAQLVINPFPNEPAPKVEPKKALEPVDMMRAQVPQAATVDTIQPVKTIIEPPVKVQSFNIEDYYADFENTRPQVRTVKASPIVETMEPEIDALKNDERAYDPIQWDDVPLERSYAEPILPEPVINERRQARAEIYKGAPPPPLRASTIEPVAPIVNIAKVNKVVSSPVAVAPVMPSVDQKELTSLKAKNAELEQAITALSRKEQQIEDARIAKLEERLAELEGLKATTTNLQTDNMMLKAEIETMQETRKQIDVAPKITTAMIADDLLSEPAPQAKPLYASSSSYKDDTFNISEYYDSFAKRPQAQSVRPVFKDAEPVEAQAFDIASLAPVNQEPLSSFDAPRISSSISADSLLDAASSTPEVAAISVPQKMQPIFEEMPAAAQAQIEVQPEPQYTPPTQPKMVQAPQVTRPSWNANAGLSLQNVLAEWSRQENADLIWDTPANFNLMDGLNVQTSYESAVETVLAQYNAQSERPVGSLYINPETGQKTLVI